MSDKNRNIDDAYAVSKYWTSHDVRYVLCDDDGTVVGDVEPDDTMLVAHACEKSGRGYVKIIAVTKTQDNIK